MNKSIVRAARVRYRHAVHVRYAATGNAATDDVARVVESRTGVPFAAIVAHPRPSDRISLRKPGCFDARPSWRVPVSGPVQFVGRLIEE